MLNNQSSLFPTTEVPEIAVTRGINHHGHSLFNFSTTNPDEAIKAAGLDWEVESVDAYYKNKAGEEVTSQRTKLIIDSLGREHGKGVSKKYPPIQNSTVARIIEPLIDNGRFKVSQGGMTNRKRCWLMLDSARVDDITGKGDDITHHMLVHWKHDGTSSVRAEFVARRVGCSNAIQGLIRQNHLVGTGAVLNIQHTSNYKHFMNMATDTLEQYVTSVDDLVGGLKVLAQTRLLDMGAYTHQLFKEPKVEDYTKDSAYWSARNKWDKTMAELEARHEAMLSSETMNMGTVWSAYSAVTEVMDHYLVNGTRGDRMEFTWFGGQDNLRIRALEEALAIVDAA